MRASDGVTVVDVLRDDGGDAMFINRRISDVGLSLRTSRCLYSDGIKTVRHLLSKTEDELLEIRNFGETCLKEVRAFLDAHALELSDGCDFAPHY